MVQEKWLVDDEKVIDFETVRSLKVSMIAGNVNIVGHDEPGARVEIHSVRGRAIKVSLDGDRLEIDHPQLSWENFIEVFASFTGKASADVSIMVPRAVALKVGVVSASALISGLRDGGSISTVSGQIVLDDLEGPIQVNSVSGEISVRDHGGTVGARSVNGDITVSGDVSNFTGETVSGSVFLDLKGTPDAAKISTVSGSITARLEPGVPARYSINMVSGKLQLDDSEIRGVNGSYTGTHGQLDKHWLDFRANTVGGSISVLHAVSA
jgi:DUF4097 and DUF4098 domain-containing protein YvlB